MSSSPKRPGWSATAIRTPNGASAPPTTTQAPLRRPSEMPISRREPRLGLPVGGDHRAAQAQRVAGERRLAGGQRGREAVGHRRRQAAQHQLAAGRVELVDGDAPDPERERCGAGDLLDQLVDRGVAERHAVELGHHLLLRSSPAPAR